MGWVSSWADYWLTIPSVSVLFPVSVFLIDCSCTQLTLLNSILAAKAALLDAHPNVPGFPNERHIYTAFIFLYTLNSSMTGPLSNLHMANPPSDISKLLLSRASILATPDPDVLQILATYIHGYVLCPASLRSGRTLLHPPCLGILKVLPRHRLAIARWQLYLPSRTNLGQGPPVVYMGRSAANRFFWCGVISFRIQAATIERTNFKLKVFWVGLCPYPSTRSPACLQEVSSSGSISPL